MGRFSASKPTKNQQNYTFGGHTNIWAAPFDRDTLPAQYAYSQTGNSEYFQSFNRAVQKASDLNMRTGPSHPRAPNFMKQAYHNLHKRPKSVASYAWRSKVYDRMRIYKPNDPYNGEDKKGYAGVQRFNENASQRSWARSTRSTRSKRRIMTAGGQRRTQTTQQVVEEVRRRKTGVSKVNREVVSAQKREKDLFETLGGEMGEAAETPLPQPADEDLPPEQDAYEQPHEEEKLQIHMEPSEVMSRGSYASKLEKDIEDERNKRHELEKQVLELKKMNSEIGSMLGLKVKKE